MNILNAILVKAMVSRNRRLTNAIDHPHAFQDTCFRYLVDMAKNTSWGKMYDYDQINSVADFKNKVPLQDYNS